MIRRPFSGSGNINRAQHCSCGCNPVHPRQETFLAIWKSCLKRSSRSSCAVLCLCGAVARLPEATTSPISVLLQYLPVSNVFVVDLNWRKDEETPLAYLLPLPVPDDIRYANLRVAVATPQVNPLSILTGRPGVTSRFRTPGGHHPVVFVFPVPAPRRAAETRFTSSARRTSPRRWDARPRRGSAPVVIAQRAAGD